MAGNRKNRRGIDSQLNPNSHVPIEVRELAERANDLEGAISLLISKLPAHSPSRKVWAIHRNTVTKLRKLAIVQLEQATEDANKQR